MKVFIFPTFNKRKDKTGNEYILYFHNSFAQSKKFKLLNNFKHSDTLSVLLNLRADVFIIHWVDLIPSKPLGRIQTIVFKLGILAAELFGKKVVWVLHNKMAHNDCSLRPMKLMKWMSVHSSLVLTHSEEGCKYFNNTFPASKAKCVFLPHPVYSSEIVPTLEKKWDYIIWGGISRRKNVLEFVKYASSCDFFRTKKILICGSCRDNALNQEIALAADGTGIVYENRFLTEKELRDRIASSGCILFTYDSRSVLSSGALIYSLNFMKPIIGPRVGSFLDMENEGIVTCFDSFEDIPTLSIANSQDARKAIERYLVENTWQTLPDKLMQIFKTYMFETTSPE